MKNLAKIQEWTPSEKKIFEKALAEFPDDTPDKWQRIAERVPGRTAKELEERYHGIVKEVMIRAARKIKLPKYIDEFARDDIAAKKRPVKEKRVGKPWTTKEHIKFLKGLEKHGKGNWKDIAKDCVKTRNGTQVASHAQKYFKRQEGVKSKNSRFGIFDITLKSAEKVSSLGSKISTDINGVQVVSDGLIDDMYTGNLVSPLSSHHQILNQGGLIVNKIGFHEGAKTMSWHPTLSHSESSTTTSNSTTNMKGNIIYPPASFTEDYSLLDDYLNQQKGDVLKDAYVTFTNSQVNNNGVQPLNQVNYNGARPLNQVNYDGVRPLNQVNYDGVPPLNQVNHNGVRPLNQVSYNGVRPSNFSTAHHLITGHPGSTSHVAGLNTSGPYYSSQMVDSQNRDGFMGVGGVGYDNSIGAPPRVNLSNYQMNANNGDLSNVLPTHNSGSMCQVVTPDMSSCLSSEQTYSDVIEELLMDIEDITSVNNGSVSAHVTFGPSS